MQFLPLLLLSCAASAVVAFSVSSSVEGATLPVEISPPAAQESSARVDQLERRCAELAALVEQLASRTARVEVPTLDRDHVHALVAEALRSQGVDVAAEQLQEPELAKAQRTPRGWFDRLRELAEEGKDSADLWQEIEAADRLDEVLDFFRAAVEQTPNSTDAQYELARAAHAAAMSRPSHRDGRFWTESDNAYGKVLEIDPQHWDARYEKAVKLTFWPEAYGRGPEALSHFETLIEQQETMPAEPRHARVYFWLGNLLAQQGKAKQAAALWRRGLDRHPSNDSLRDRLASMPR